MPSCNFRRPSRETRVSFAPEMKQSGCSYAGQHRCQIDSDQSLVRNALPDSRRYCRRVAALAAGKGLGIDCDRLRPPTAHESRVRIDGISQPLYIRKPALGIERGARGRNQNQAGGMLRPFFSESWAGARARSRSSSSVSHCRARQWPTPRPHPVLSQRTQLRLCVVRIVLVVDTDVRPGAHASGEQRVRCLRRTTALLYGRVGESIVASGRILL